jgi:hypothetical protein
VGKHREARQKFPAACTSLEADLTLAELALVLSELKDKGAGIDGVSAAGLAHLQHETQEWLLDQLNEVWHRGLSPADWAEIRVVLLYKGKGSDPYCLDNYRGLGIGAVLEKVLSLIMMKRLESFLTTTSALHPSQGGFRPQRGPPEQTFTLSEAVRAALRARGVSPAFLCFIDIERAYDSVQHAKLWARCIEMGIGGRFLSTLQAMHAGKKAVLDVNGELLGSQDIETGVLQGNPLSPLLFNIYIDALVRRIDDFAAKRGAGAGVPLPRVGADLLGPPPSEPSSLDVLYSLFFADDGVLIARDRATLQAMLDAVVAELGEICLLLNAKKTKVLIVPPLTATEAQYEVIKGDVAAAGGFTARGEPVRIVDQFLYLGVMLWWRWNWKRACEHALGRAKRVLYLLRKSGFQHQGAAMAHQLKYASSVVGSHIDYVSALAGVDGYVAETKAFAKLSADLLRVVSCTPPGTSGPALQSMFGVWDPDTRTRMLQLRFFCKISCMPRESTHVRAMHLSFAQCQSHPGTIDGGWSQLCPWASQVLRAVTGFEHYLRVAGQPQVLISADLSRPVLALVQLERLAGTGAWLPVSLATPDDASLAGQLLRVRSVNERKFGVDYSTGRRVGVWEFPVGTSIRSALCTWSVPLRCAVFVTLRWLGNCFRHGPTLFAAEAEEWAEPDAALRDLAPLKSASYAEPFVFLVHVAEARRLLHALVGKWGEEFGYRRIPRGPVKRIDDPAARACYLCPAATWLPETMSHLLLRCPHRCMVRLRVAVRADLAAIAAKARLVSDCPPAPDFSNDVQLYTVLMLCTGVGIVRDPAALVGVLVPHPLPGAAVAVASLADQRRNHALRLDAAVMRPAVRWVAFLLGRWRSQLSEALTVVDGAAVGESLALAVCSHSLRVYSARRRLLRGDAAFEKRSRDPDDA